MSRTDPMSALKDAGQGLLSALGDKATSTISERVGDLTDRLQGVADGDGPVAKAVKEGGKESVEGGSPVKGALKGAASGIKDKITGGGSSSGGGKATKSTNIIETIDVGVPVSVAYNQWTEFGAFPTFMKKVESVKAEDETKINFKAQIFLSHRSWQATILEQVPDERIVWRSEGQKGHVDGAVTFHEIGPNLTRILVVLEYYPQGLFEKTGNIWEAQGRRARAELRHFRRHVMTRTLLNPDEVEGWRGVIEDGEVVQSHEEVVEQEQAEADQESEEQDDQPEDEYEESEEEPEDEYEEPEDDAEEEPEDEPEDEYEEPEEEPEDEPEDEYEEPEDESEEEPEDEYEEPEDDAEVAEEEPEEEAEDEYEEPEGEDEEPEDDAEVAEEEPEDEYEESDEEPEEEPEKPRRRRRSR
jgi:uncharacterized membrane protein